MTSTTASRPRRANRTTANVLNETAPKKATPAKPTAKRPAAKVNAKTGTTAKKNGRTNVGVIKPAARNVAGNATIDETTMLATIALRKDGKSMKEIGEILGVKATGYLSKKVRETYGAEALKPAKESK